MTKNKDDKLIHIRTFKSMDEIREQDGFIDNNPVDKDNYEDLIGDYTFDHDVKCCRKKDNGNLCNTDHQWGFVVILKDNSVSIIGNHCIKTKFEPDSNIRQRRNLYINEQKRLKQLERLDELRKHKAGNLVHLDNIKLTTSRIKDSASTFSTIIGNATADKLELMAKQQDGSVFIDAISYRTYTDEDGYEQKESTTVITKLGTLSGIKIFNPQTFQSIYSAIRAIKLAYDRADQLTDKSKITEIEHVSSAIGDINRIDIELRDLEKAVEQFFKSDLQLLCFLVEDKAERYKAARYVLDKSGVSVGREKAKAWLTEQEKKIKAELNVEKIRIHG